MLFASTIFLSAFLLFQVQPMIAKIILPWFGGSPGVWTTCMLFFQSALLAGYAYSHLVVSRLPLRVQPILHGALLISVLALLPIVPSDQWKPVPGDDPTLKILELLTFTVGGPYFLLASTGPLLQAWFARMVPGKSPYRLYAVSNTGSLLALLSYPFFVEPNTRVKTQTIVWSAAFVLFAALCAWIAWRLYRYENTQTANADARPEVNSSEQNMQAPGYKNIILWLTLPMLASVVLLATTNILCRDLSVIPFLWVLPLSLYLLSFIICFDHERWYVRSVFLVGMMACIVASCVILNKIVLYHIGLQIGLFSVTAFFCCMVCHGEVVRLKPPPSHLTLFYLMIALGGAMGGAFVALGAPLLFRDLWEFHLAMAACCVLGLFTVISDYWSRETNVGWSAQVICVATVIGGLLGIGGLISNVFRRQEAATVRVRNFYGPVQIVDDYTNIPEYQIRRFIHGSTTHGLQYLAPDKRELPISYFDPHSGLGLAFTKFPGRKSGKKLRVGVIGLGTGTIAAYARRGDYVRFYEIDPLVVRLCHQYFTYLQDATSRGADVDIFLGDGRLVMQNQLRQNGAQRFDILAIDAFSSDAIPVHLLTRECFHMYWKHLKPDGILIVQRTNRYLDVAPVVSKLASIEGKTAVPIDQWGDGVSIYPNSYMLVTSNREFLRSKAVIDAVRATPRNEHPPILWTDDFSSIYPILK